MEYSIKQIGERLRGLRDVLDIPEEEVAELCQISLEHYRKIERGEADPSVYRLMKISKKYGISLNVLLFGEEAHMTEYFVTRNDEGLKVGNTNYYEYESLGCGFLNRRVEPFLVRLDPMPEGKSHNVNRYQGQEFDYVLEGTLELTIDDKVITLNAGDSIYYDSSVDHRMQSLNGKPCTFLCIVI